ncbi:hypothetical protein GF324_09730, partial [bacterium]|nr:hypothetical protein [bacterium]
MRRWIALFALMMLCVVQVNAGTMVRTYTFPDPDLETLGRYVQPSLEGTMLLGDPGEPILPVRSHTFLLPPGEALHKVEVKQILWETVAKGVTVLPQGAFLPISQMEYADPEPDASIYNSNSFFPLKPVSDLQTGYLRGHSIGSYLLHPLRWNPDSGELQVAREVQLQIQSAPDSEAEAALALLKTGSRTERLLRQCVDELSHLPRYNALDDLDELEPSMIIICSDAWTDEWEEYAEFKRTRGIETLVLSTADIYNDFEGDDNQEKIRNAILDYYLFHTTEYVLLGGDVNTVPYRGFYNSTAGQTDYNIPADLYYSGLDGSWNSDGDNRWGEENEDDLYQEVSIGRAPITSTSMLEDWIAKQVAYQDDPVVDEMTNALMVGEDLGWVNWGGEHKDEVRFGSSNYGYSTEGFPAGWDVSTIYDMDNVWSVPELFSELNSGVHIVNHLGHSNVTYTMKASNHHVTDSQLTNNGTNHTHYMAYSQGCYCGAFEQNSITEKWTTIANGAFAYISNSRYGWGSGSSTNGPSQRYDREFFDAFFGEEIHRIGDTNRDSKHDCIPVIGQTCMRWCFYELNLFGDPSIDLYTGQPEEMTVNLPAQYFIGSPGLEVNVEGVEGARVAVLLDGDLQAVGITDENGDAVIEVDVMEQVTLDVVVTAHNRLAYTDEVVVLQA